MLLDIHAVCYEHPDREPLFNNVSLSVDRGQKVSLVGDNGSGKSTLLKIAAGVLKPSSGSVSRTAEPFYVPQHFGQYDGFTVARMLGVEAVLDALDAISRGDASESNFAAVGDNWQVEEDALRALSEWDMDHLSLRHPLASLSGGEKTRVLLAGISLHRPELILFDEPTNHLDIHARRRLYDMVERGDRAMVVVSHDRTLLGLMERTCELSAGGIVCYGGDYEFFRESRDREAGARLDEVAEMEKALRKARKTAREAAERKARSDGKGAAKAKKEGVPRIMLKTIADGAAASERRVKGEHDAKIRSLTDEVREARSKLAPERELKIKLAGAAPAGKVLVEVAGLNYAYPDGSELWPRPLDFRICGGDRLALAGGNGSGKTTLLKLILGELTPTSGTLRTAEGIRILYIDQEYSAVDDHLTVFEQAQRFNARNLPEHMVKTELHRFLLPADMWDKPCATLSGGEKMKLLFCCMLLGDSSPDLFILDEPANNLDIGSLEIVSRALRSYEGALIVVSHDEYFLREAGIPEAIIL